MSRMGGPRYRGNGLPPRKMRYGPKTNDQVTGFPTYEDKLVTDDYGYKVDPRYYAGGPDIDHTKDFGPRR